MELRGKAKGAAPFDQILDAIERGGFIFPPKADRRGNLRKALGKDKRILRLPNDTYGLREWYGRRFKKDENSGATDDNVEETSEESPESEPEADPSAPEKKDAPVKRFKLPTKGVGVTKPTTAEDEK